MKVSLTINGTDFGPYIKENGISITPFFRNEKEVVTLDGTSYYTSIKKNKMTVNLLDMSDSEYLVLTTKLYQSPLASVTYTELDRGVSTTSNYYVKNLQYTSRMAIGTMTFMTGLSFELEEK